ncbi:TM2 domain-containing protein [Entomospira culicis]|uniref:TM2 domain-containing protein n=1 Tax=Entomospira culicis TaxID=2719989 RepID=A0A968KXB8_9SPIO|nr:TM2 domain-containing protein [Entomospira culicis]NIZ19943.1 TM2 domain-containing protein [Entomospira culicis]NIZ70192.1 TM2 domain-containing protein [Entomospira culicis]WDI38025.1 TM2 domain-containing protein [Entomospira culicis]WDI39648.1 TM2 domain-containing protein [Entomospira culicis]
MLEVSSSVEKVLPSSVKTAVGQLPSEKQAIFEEDFKKKMKNPIIGLLLAIFLPGWSFIYLGKIGLAFAFWFTAGGMGIWWIIDIATVMKKITEYNEDQAKTIMRDMKAMGH